MKEGRGRGTGPKLEPMGEIKGQAFRQKEDPLKPFNWRIQRPLALRLGLEAVAIIEAGHYESPSGKTVDIAALIESAKAGTETRKTQPMNAASGKFKRYLFMAPSFS